jgi:ADP-ribose pyrophosphatase
MDLPAENLETIKRYLELDLSLYEETIDDEVQWKGRIFSADVLKVKLPDGSYATREIAWHHGGCGVAAFRDGKLCLVRQYRVALGQMTLEIPAGKLEMGEEPVTCAARELTEETGLVADELVPLAVSAGSIGFTNAYVRPPLTRRHPPTSSRAAAAWRRPRPW